MTNYWPVVGGDAPTALLSVRSPFLQDTTLSEQEAFLIFPVKKICIVSSQVESWEWNLEDLLTK